MNIAELFLSCAKDWTMRHARFEKEIEALLSRPEDLTVEDFIAACPGMPLPSVYSTIHRLVQDGRLSVVGIGRYISVRKPAYQIELTPWMMEVHHYLQSECVGISHCLSERNHNLYVEALKEDVPTVMKALSVKYPKTVMRKDADRFPGKLEGYVIAGNIISESPVVSVSGVSVPTLEKELADGFASKKNPLDAFAFQKAMEIYPVNQNRLLRYAARRGVAEEVSKAIQGLNQPRLDMFASVQRYLSTLPVSKAWVFGSFARGEERPDSDLDLLIEYSPEVKLSLLTIVGYKLDLEKKIGREVDWVEDGYLKPFAKESAEKDKYLIYAR